MAHEIKMPQLGLTMTEGTVGRWLKKEGDVVNEGDPLVEIETDKLASEIESEFSGILLKIVQEEGNEVPVQTVLCVIGEKNEEISVNSSSHEDSESHIATTLQPNIEQKNTEPLQHNDRIKISPLARKIAADKNIDLSKISGTGPNGRIVKRDVLNFEQVNVVVANTEIPSESIVSSHFVEGSRREKMKSMRKVVATRMLKSHLDIPNVTQTIKVDVTNLITFRKQLNQNREKSSSFSINDFILKATAKALSYHKEILVSIEGDEIIYHNDVNLGMAVGIDGGLIVPVINNANILSLENLSMIAKLLANKAREGSLTAEEYKGNTFTISNLGMYGIESFTPIINQPDAAILGVCSVQDELDIDIDGKLIKKQVMRLSLTYDHRLLDGVVVAKFQQTLCQLLENPINILI